MAINDTLAALATRLRDSRGASITLTAAEAQDLLSAAQGKQGERTVEFQDLDNEVGATLESMKGGGYDYPAKGNAGVIDPGAPEVVQEGARGDAILKQRAKEREEAFEAQGMTVEGKIPEGQPVNLNAASPTFGQPVPALDQPKGQKPDSSKQAAEKRAGIMDATSGKQRKAGTKEASKAAVKSAVKKSPAKASKKGAK